MKESSWIVWLSDTWQQYTSQTSQFVLLRMLCEQESCMSCCFVSWIKSTQIISANISSVAHPVARRSFLSLLFTATLNVYAWKRNIDIIKVFVTIFLVIGNAIWHNLFSHFRQIWGSLGRVYHPLPEVQIKFCYEFRLMPPFSKMSMVFR